MMTHREFFDSEWYKDGTKQLCADGWPTFVVPVNIKIRNLLEDYENLQKENDNLKNYVVSGLEVMLEELKKENAILLEALELAVKSGEFFIRHADCRKDSWSCRCEFCKDNSASKNLREARQALEKVSDDFL